jgi:hypothetical protein
MSMNAARRHNVGGGRRGADDSPWTRDRASAGRNRIAELV